MKNSFILYNDQAEVVKALNNEQAGQLFKLIFSYIEGEKIEENEIDPIVKIAFIPIKTTLKRDLSKWEAYVEKQTANGIKGGRPRKEKTQKTQAFISKPKKADSVSVSVSVSDSENIYTENLISEPKENTPTSKQSLIKGNNSGHLLVQNGSPKVKPKKVGRETSSVKHTLEYIKSPEAWNRLRSEDVFKRYEITDGFLEILTAKIENWKKPYKDYYKALKSWVLNAISRGELIDKHKQAMEERIAFFRMCGETDVEKIKAYKFTPGKIYE